MALWIFILAVLIPVSVIGFLASKLIKYNTKKAKKERKGAKKQARKENTNLPAVAEAATPATESAKPTESETKKTE
jgi:hypothetical protein